MDSREQARRINMLVDHCSHYSEGHDCACVNMITDKLNEAKREGMEEAAKIADDYGCDCEHSHCHDSHDIRNLILSRAQEVK